MVNDGATGNDEGEAKEKLLNDNQPSPETAIHHAGAMKADSCEQDKLTLQPMEYLDIPPIVRFHWGKISYHETMGEFAEAAAIRQALRESGDPTPPLSCAGSVEAEDEESDGLEEDIDIATPEGQEVRVTPVCDVEN